MDKITEGITGKYRIVRYIRLTEDKPKLFSVNEAIVEQKRSAAQEHFYYPEVIYRIEPVDREVKHDQPI